MRGGRLCRCRGAARRLVAATESPAALRKSAARPVGCKKGVDAARTVSAPARDAAAHAGGTAGSHRRPGVPEISAGLDGRLAASVGGRGAAAEGLPAARVSPAGAAGGDRGLRANRARAPHGGRGFRDGDAGGLPHRALLAGFPLPPGTTRDPDRPEQSRSILARLASFVLPLELDAG